MAEARDLLPELIVATIREGEDLPELSLPSPSLPLVERPVKIGLKAALCDSQRLLAL